MPKAHKGNLSVADLFGIEDTITTHVDGVHEYLSIPSKQLDIFDTYISSLAKRYKENANNSISKHAQEFAHLQQQIAETLGEIGRNVATIEHTGIVIKSPREETISNKTPPQSPLSPPAIDIFLQPEQSVNIPKGSASPRRKQIFPLSALGTSGKKFVLNGQIIKHLTIYTQRGGVLDLFRLNNSSSQKDVAKAAYVGDDYRALSFVLRDLKDDLEKNNLVLHVSYDAESKIYKPQDITRYIRVPKRKKKTVKSS